MIYELGLSEADLYPHAADPSDDTEAKELPDGSMMIMRDIWAALDGDDYHYYPAGTEGKGIKVSGCPPVIWDYYLGLFTRCEEFGLPKGQGWMDEPPWLLDFLIFMRREKFKVKSWRDRKQSGNRRDTSRPAELWGGD